MALFPHLDFEKKLQINDRTRLNASKSFVSKGSTAISEATIKAGDDASAIDIYDSDRFERYLDWEFKIFNGDFDASRNILQFKENSGSELTATITVGTYTLATLATEIKTQMEAAGAFTYTVSVSSDDKISISTTDGSFSLLPTEGSTPLRSILPFIGITVKPGHGDSKWSGQTSVTGERVRWMPKNVTLDIGDGTTNESEVSVMQLYSVEGDALFSSDAEMLQHVPDILSKVPKGRNSWLNMHRAAQELIIADLRKAGFVDTNNDPLEVKAIVDKREVREWALFRALRLTMDFLSVSKDDKQFEEAREFESLEKEYNDLNFLRLDLTGDEKAEVGEGINMASARAVRI